MAAVTSNTLVSTIESELLRVKEDLKEVDENLKRLTGRDFHDNQPQHCQRIEREKRTKLSSAGRDGEPPPKRRPPGGVFARLGAPVLEASRNESRSRLVQEFSVDDERKQKPTVSSSVSRPVVDGKSRTEAAAELTKDRASRDRNRRMFGALIGTLQRFRSDEAKQKDKEEQRAAIERKLEEKGKAEKEELRRERLDLFNQRKERQAKIKRLGFKMARVKEYESWEDHQRKLEKFIRTTSSPRIFWMPKIHNSQSSLLVSATKGAIEEELGVQRARLTEELNEVLKGGRAEVQDTEDYEEDSVRRDSRRRSADGEEEPREEFSNCPDLLDYEAEEGELVYDELFISGKKTKEPERVVVQVGSDRAVEGGGGGCMSRRKVELVSVVAPEGRKADKWKPIQSKIKDESESEKENHMKKKKERMHSKDNEKKHKKEKLKDERKERKSKKHEHSSKSRRENEKKMDKVESEEKRSKSPIINSHQDSSKDSNKPESKPKEEPVKLESKVDVTPPDKKMEHEEIWSEDLSHISLPLEPQPVLSDYLQDDSQSSLPSVKPKNVEDHSTSKEKSDDNAGKANKPDIVIDTLKHVDLPSESNGQLSEYKVDSKKKSSLSKEGRTDTSDDEITSSSDSEDSSSDSDSSLSDSSSGSSVDSESASSSSLTDSSDDSDGGKDRSKRPRKRRTSSSSVSSSEDEKRRKKQKTLSGGASSLRDKKHSSKGGSRREGSEADDERNAKGSSDKRNKEDGKQRERERMRMKERERRHEKESLSGRKNKRSRSRERKRDRK